MTVSPLLESRERGAAATTATRTKKQSKGAEGTAVIKAMQRHGDDVSAVFGDVGFAVVGGVLSEETVEKLSKWTDECLNKHPDRNARHPKQADRLLVNNVAQRLGVEHPELLLDLLDALGRLVDPLLGLARLGSLTMHVTEGRGGEAQTAHVDYPLHAGSGHIWDDASMARVTTAHQRNHVYPYMTVQVLIALQKITEHNGCTQLVAGSHRWDDVDTLVTSPPARMDLDADNKWTNAELSPGDALVFNRRVVHRGGGNLSGEPRRACIAQLVMPFVTPQQSPPSPSVVEAVLAEARRRGKSSPEELRLLELRLRFPYPCETEHRN